MSENKKVVEIHGCIVCAKPFNVLVVRSSENKLLDCTVTSPGGQCVQNDRRPLVACDTHTQAEIAAAYKKWQLKNGKASSPELEEV